MAYAFAAASAQYLSVADTAAVDITGALTVSCWCRMNSTSDISARGLVAKWVTATNQRSYNLTQTTAKKINVNVSSSGSFQAANSATGATDLSNNTWQHVSMVFNPSTSVTVFLDGLQDGQVTSSVSASIYNSTSNLWIGMTSEVSSAGVFNGDISDVAVYNTNLNAAEIKSLAKGFKPSRVRPQNLVFYAPLIRTLQDPKGALTITNNNTATVANHPRVI